MPHERPRSSRKALCGLPRSFTHTLVVFFATLNLNPVSPRSLPQAAPAAPTAKVDDDDDDDLFGDDDEEEAKPAEKSRAEKMAEAKAAKDAKKKVDR